MSEQPKPGAPKLSTKDILAAARAQAAKAGGAPAPAAAEAAPQPPAEVSSESTPAASATPAAEKPSAKPPAKKPGSTADILAAARAQATRVNWVTPGEEKLAKLLEPLKCKALDG